MAMIQCKECGKDISDAAAACPQCGCPVAKAAETAPAAPVAPAVSRSKKIMSAIGSTIGVIGVICLILFNVFKDDLTKMALDEKVTRSLNDLCEERFNRKPFKITPKENYVYEVIFNDPDGKEIWPYITEPVKFKYVKNDDGESLDFASDADRALWKSGRKMYSARD